MEKMRYRRRTILSMSEGGTAGFVWAEITGLPKYNSSTDYFTVEKVNWSAGQWVKDGSPIQIDRAIGYEGYGTNDAKDIRNWIPWPPIGSIVQIVEKEDEEAEGKKWFIASPSMIYTGPESQTSIRHNESNGCAEVVWI